MPSWHDSAEIPNEHLAEHLCNVAFVVVSDLELPGLEVILVAGQELTLPVTGYVSYVSLVLEASRFKHTAVTS